jgi:hypothetical protein
MKTINGLNEKMSKLIFSKQKRAGDISRLKICLDRLKNDISLLDIANRLKGEEENRDKNIIDSIEKTIELLERLEEAF